jgi:hypothetical protein
MRDKGGEFSDSCQTLKSIEIDITSILIINIESDLFVSNTEFSKIVLEMEQNNNQNSNTKLITVLDRSQIANYNRNLNSILNASPNWKKKHNNITHILRWWV